MTALDVAAESRIRDSIGRQTLLTTLGAEIVELATGRVVMDLPFRADLCQQNGYLHAGAIAAVADTACGYAAMTLLPPGREVLTVEFKINLVSPARGERFRAAAEVVRAGRTLTVCSAEVTAWADGVQRQPVALMQATMMAVAPA